MLFPAHSVMTPAFPSMASLCLFLLNSFPQLPLKLEFSFSKYFVSYTCSRVNRKHIYSIVIKSEEAETFPEVYYEAVLLPVTLLFYFF